MFPDTAAALSFQSASSVSVEVNTKEMCSRAYSTSSHGNQRHFLKVSQLQRRGSSGSMAERSFYEPSSVLMESTIETPPIPPLPKISQLRRLHSLREPTSRCTSTVPRATGSVSNLDIEALFGSNSSQNVLTRRKSNLNSTVGRPVNFSLPTDSRPTSPVTQRCRNSPLTMNPASVVPSSNQKIKHDSLTKKYALDVGVPRIEPLRIKSDFQQIQNYNSSQSIENRTYSLINGKFKNGPKDMKINLTEIDKRVSSPPTERPCAFTEDEVRTNPPHFGPISPVRFLKRESLNNAKNNEYPKFVTLLQDGNLEELPLKRTLTHSAKSKKNEQFSNLPGATTDNQEIALPVFESRSSYLSSPRLYDEQGGRLSLASTNSESSQLFAKFDQSSPCHIDRILIKNDTRLHDTKNFDGISKTLTLKPITQSAKSSDTLSIKQFNPPIYKSLKSPLNCINSSSGCGDQVHEASTDDNLSLHKVSFEGKNVCTGNKNLSINESGKENIPRNQLRADIDKLQGTDGIPGIKNNQVKRIRPRLSAFDSNLGIENWRESDENCQVKASETTSSTPPSSPSLLPSPTLRKSQSLACSSSNSSITFPSGDTKQGNLASAVKCQEKLPSPIDIPAHDSRQLNFKETRRPVSMEAKILSENFNALCDKNMKTSESDSSFDQSNIVKSTQDAHSYIQPKIETPKTRRPNTQIEWPHIPGAWESPSDGSGKSSSSGFAARSLLVNLTENFPNQLSKIAVNGKFKKTCTNKSKAPKSCTNNYGLKTSNENPEEESEVESIYCDATEIISDLSDKKSAHLDAVSENSIKTIKVHSNLALSRRETIVTESVKSNCFGQIFPPKFEETNNEIENMSNDNEMEQIVSHQTPDINMAQVTRQANYTESVDSARIHRSQWDRYLMRNQQSSLNDQKFSSSSTMQTDSTAVDKTTKEYFSARIAPSNEEIHDSTPDVKILHRKGSKISSQGSNLTRAADVTQNLNSSMCDSGEFDATKLGSFPQCFDGSQSPNSITSSRSIVRRRSSPNYIPSTCYMRNSHLSKFSSISSRPTQDISTLMPPSRFSYSSDDKESVCPISESRFSDSSDEDFAPFSRSSKHSDAFETIKAGDLSDSSDIEYPPVNKTKKTKCSAIPGTESAFSLLNSVSKKNSSNILSMNSSLRLPDGQRRSFISTILRKKKKPDKVNRKSETGNFPRRHNRSGSLQNSSISKNTSNLLSSGVENSISWPLPTSVINTLNSDNIPRTAMNTLHSDKIPRTAMNNLNSNNIPRTTNYPSVNMINGKSNEKKNMPHINSNATVCPVEKTFAINAKKKKLGSLRRIFKLNV